MVRDMNKYAVLICILITLLPCTSFAVTLTKVQDSCTATDNDCQDLMFISSGFAAGEETDFNTEVTGNITKTNTVNWFSTNQADINIWRCFEEDTTGVEKDKAAVEAARDDCVTAGGYYETSPWNNLDTTVLVIHNTATGQEDVEDYYAALYLSSSSYTVAAHELGHLIGCGALCDEYFTTPLDPVCYSQQCLNIHDKNSNELWSDLEAGSPSLGGKYCAASLYRPTSNSIMRNSASGTVFDGVGIKCMDNGKMKQTGEVETNAPTYTDALVHGVDSGDVKHTKFKVTARPTDATGIYHTEFYLKDDPDYTRSVGVDKTSPYEVFVTPSDHSSVGVDTFRTYALDTYLSYTGVDIPFTLDPWATPGTGCTTAFYIDRDCDGFGVGFEYMSGPDVDDDDATLTDAASVSDMETHIGTTLGYAPTSEWIFVDPDNYDGSPTRSATYATAEGDPYQTVVTAVAAASAGDTIVVKAGTYDENMEFSYAPDGTSGNPVVLMAYPGDLIVFSPEVNMAFTNRDYWVLDGVVINLQTQNVVYIGESNNFTIRYCEIYNGSNNYGEVFGHNHRDFTFEYNLLREPGALSEHLMYIGSNYWAAYESSDWVIRGNVFRSGWGATSSGDNLQINAMHLNTNTISITDNVFAGTKNFAAITLYGVTDTTISGNLFLGPHPSVFRIGYSWSYSGLSTPEYFVIGNQKNISITDNRILLMSNTYAGGASSEVVRLFDGIDWSPTAWQATHSYTYAGEFVSPTTPNGYIYAAKASCTSGGGEPTWPTTPRDTVVDGGCTWYTQEIMVGKASGNSITDNYIYSYTKPAFVFMDDARFYDGTTVDSWAISGNTMAVGSGDFATALSVGKTFAQFEALDDGQAYAGIENNTNSVPLFTTIFDDYTRPEDVDLDFTSASFPTIQGCTISGGTVQ